MSRVVVHSDADNDDSDGPSSSFCPPFHTDAAHDAYVAHFAPPRELVCPITQELFRDPVVAGDGHTYERASIVTWFGTGQTRSPVTNALLENASVAGLVPNLAAAGLAAAHRSRLGGELAQICRGVADIAERGEQVDVVGVGARMVVLLDSGADPNRRGEGGNTPLHLVRDPASLVGFMICCAHHWLPCSPS